MYTTYDFYKNTYFGDTIVDSASFDKLGSRASDFVDQITFGRLRAGLPDIDYENESVQKAVCAVADALSDIDKAQNSANSQDESNIKSKSAGSESVSYGTTETVITKALQSEAGKQNYLYEIARPYLSGIAGKDGICLLYMGVM